MLEFTFDNATGDLKHSFMTFESLNVATTPEKVELIKTVRAYVEPYCT